MRDFSDSIKFSVVRDNLEKNNGRICCEVCGKELKSIDEGHFDHIEAFAKGGKSTKNNCQILCSNCNLKKNDKELNDFLLDEKARRFLEGNVIDTSKDDNNETKQEIYITKNVINNNDEDMTKEKFDLIISKFIEENGKISKVDFGREYNNLPSIRYVKEYYNDINTLKKSFGIEDRIDWNRDTIKEAFERFIEENGDVFEKDLKSKNGLPSYPCILKYFPEYAGLNEFKSDLFNLKVNMQWNREEAIKAGKKFVEKNGIVTQKDLKSKNGLPVAGVIYKYFGNMENYQKEIGSKITRRNELITKEEIDRISKEFISKNGKVFETRNDFLEAFPLSESVVYRNFGNIDNFCEKYDVIIKKRKKNKFSKQEIDDAILKYIKDGNEIPSTSKSLVPLGLPSREAILRYYRDWHEPFVLYSKLYEKIN